MRETGYVVDLGTTTIDSCIVDLKSGEELCRFAEKNPQSLYGSDVMNRILTVARDSSYLDKLSHAAIEVFWKQLLEWFTVNKLCKLKQIVIAGNTTMISILLKKDVTGMADYPFTPELSRGGTILFSELFSDFCTRETEEIFTAFSDCPVFFTGCISAFLGGDILAGLYYIEKKMNTRDFLFLDFGTNGEMILSYGGRLYGCSTACGPAFEGCMRSQKVHGSTALEAISLGRKLKKIDEYGCLLPEYLDDGVDILGVHLDAEILRQIMLAKAALYAGVQTLFSRAGIEASAIPVCYLAGGFGFHLNRENAAQLGMLPKTLLDKTEVLGNTSLLGGKEILRGTDYKETFEEKISSEVTVLDLTAETTFRQLLIQECRFAPL